jgi:hypothetical protein
MAPFVWTGTCGFWVLNRRCRVIHGAGGPVGVQLIQHEGAEPARGLKELTLVGSGEHEIQHHVVREQKGVAMICCRFSSPSWPV